MEQRHLPENAAASEHTQPAGIVQYPSPAAIEAHVEARRQESVTVQTLTRLFEKERHSSRDKQDIFVIMPVVALFLIFGLGCLDAGQMACGWGLLLGGIFAVAGLFKLRYTREADSLEKLAPLKDKRQIELLILLLQANTDALRHFALQNLLTLLPTLYAGDAFLLKRTQREILLQQLALLPSNKKYRARSRALSRAAYRREMDLRLAILKSLEQVGGEQELPVVERLAQGSPFPPSKQRVPEELRQAALQCLPSLQARAADQRAHTQLLRASNLPAASSADLLRPAAAGASSPSDQLLRASEPFL